MSEGERWIDLVREGVDCVLRFGNPPDSDLVARRVVTLTRQTCAAPGISSASARRRASKRSTVIAWSVCAR